MTSAFYSSVDTVPAGKSNYPVQFLVPVGVSSNEAWVLAGAGYGGSGSLKIRLVDAYGTALSDHAEIFGSDITRVKLLGVSINNVDHVPKVVKVEATNNSQQGGDAKVLELSFIDAVVGIAFANIWETINAAMVKYFDSIGDTTPKSFSFYIEAIIIAAREGSQTEIDRLLSEALSASVFTQELVDYIELWKLDFKEINFQRWEILQQSKSTFDDYSVIVFWLTRFYPDIPSIAKFGKIWVDQMFNKKLITGQQWTNANIVLSTTTVISEINPKMIKALTDDVTKPPTTPVDGEIINMLIAGVISDQLLELSEEHTFTSAVMVPVYIWLLKDTVIEIMRGIGVSRNMSKSLARTISMTLLTKLATNLEWNTVIKRNLIMQSVYVFVDETLKL